MTSMFGIAGLILGLGMFFMIRKTYRGAVKKGELAGVVFTCESCNKTCPAADAWKRTRMGGRDVFRCPSCGVKVVK